MNQYTENILEQFLDELPYYWDTDNPQSNIYRFATVLASLFGVWQQEANKIRQSRPIEKASGDSLDYVGSDVGVVRDVVSFISDKTDLDIESENDEMLRERIKWNIFLQESSSLVEEIKKIIAQGLKMYRVRVGLGGETWDPDLERSEYQSHIPPYFNIPDGHYEKEVRTIDENDISIYENKSTNLDMKAPDADHGKFGSLNKYYEVHIPWKALPWEEGENAFIWASQDTFDDPSQPPEDKVHGWNEGILNAEEAELQLEPVETLVELSRPAGASVAIHGEGGFIWASQEEFDDPNDPPEDELHGWNRGKWDGDLEEAKYAMENHSNFWLD